MVEALEATSWRLILETALDAVVVMDCSGNVVDWNDNAASVFGWTRDEIVGRLMADFIIPPNLRPAHDSGLQRYLQSGEAKVIGRRIEIMALRRSGEEFPIELSITPITRGSTLLFLGYVRDISERRSFERLREQHALKMEALYETISFAAEHSSLDTALEVCLASVHKLTGWPLGQVFVPSSSLPRRLQPSPIWQNFGGRAYERVRAATEAATFKMGEGLPGRVWESREPIWISNVNSEPNFPRASSPGGIEVRSAVGFPIVAQHQVIAVVEFFSDVEVRPDVDLLKTLQAIGEQVGRVFERHRARDALVEHARSLEAEVEERKKAEEQQRLLLAEVNHRVKNMLAVVMAIAAQTGKHSASIEEFRHSYSQRLAALSAAHSLITSSNWQATSLWELAARVMSPFDIFGERILVKGPLVFIPSKAVLGVSMVLHEIGTNALKYGGLATPTGQVALTWTVRDEPTPAVKIQWRESGAGPVSAPTRSGYGSTMIRAIVQPDLKGNMKIVHASDGFEYEFEFPLSQPQ